MLAIASRTHADSDIRPGRRARAPVPRRQLRPRRQRPLLRSPRRRRSGRRSCREARRVAPELVLVDASRGHSAGRRGVVDRAPQRRHRSGRSTSGGSTPAALLAEVGGAGERALRRRLVRRRPLATVTGHRSLAARLQRDNRALPALPRGGVPDRAAARGRRATRPSARTSSGSRPGQVEAATGLPWQGRAGRTLRRWLRLDEEEFFARFYCASVTRCYPGPSAGGRGDRRGERGRRGALLRLARDELRLLDPRARRHGRPWPARTLLGIGRSPTRSARATSLGDAVAVPLPHPSGASGWLNDRRTVRVSERRSPMSGASWRRLRSAPDIGAIGSQR